MAIFSSYASLPEAILLLSYKKSAVFDTEPLEFWDQNCGWPNSWLNLRYCVKLEKKGFFSATSYGAPWWVETVAYHQQTLWKNTVRHCKDVQQNQTCWFGAWLRLVTLHHFAIVGFVTGVFAGYWSTNDTCWFCLGSSDKKSLLQNEYIAVQVSWSNIPIALNNIW